MNHGEHRTITPNMPPSQNTRANSNLEEPYEGKLSRTVLWGGKLERVYLSRLGQRVFVFSMLNSFHIGSVNPGVVCLIINAKLDTYYPKPSDLAMGRLNLL